MQTAFADLRVIDFTQVIAGPLATAQLAMLGADVIKIEAPGSSDLMRHVMAEGELLEAGLSPPFQGLNVGKRSMTLDLKSAEAAEVMERLIGKADVVVENFRPGVMDRLGFGYPQASAIRPEIVYCSVSGYGQTGPKAGEPAYDGPMQAETGMMSVNGRADGGPTRVAFWAIDALTGMNAAMAIFAALWNRERTGQGAHVDTAMIDAAINLMSPQVIDWLNQGRQPARAGTRTAAGLPTDDVFPTASGEIQITAISEKQISDLLNELGLGNCRADSRFCSATARLENADALRGLIVEELTASSAETWHGRFRARGIPCSPVRTIPEFLSDPQTLHRGAVLKASAPDSLEVPPADIVNAGFRANFQPGNLPPAPRHGQHTDEILSELGYGASEIAALRDKGAI